MSALPKFTIRDLLEAGVHYGHKTMRWNPKMSPFIYGSRNNVHIIDLQQTGPMLYRALIAVQEIVSNNGRVLFVGTKRQASQIIEDAAKRCGQYYVNHRWLGGMLTNWETVSSSLKVLDEVEGQLAEPATGYTKKERLNMERKYQKLMRSLGGIREMGGKPDLLVVIDTNKENIAILEARKLNIPIVAILDTNSDPDNIDYPIPGNDDAGRAISLYCQLFSDAVLAGIQQGLARSGVDIGENDKLFVRDVEVNVENVANLDSNVEDEVEEVREGPTVENKKSALKKVINFTEKKNAEEAEGEESSMADKAKSTAKKPAIEAKKKPIAVKKADAGADAGEKKAKAAAKPKKTAKDKE